MKLLIVAVLVVGCGLLANVHGAPQGDGPSPTTTAAPASVCDQYKDRNDQWASGVERGWSALWEAEGEKAACHGQNDKGQGESIKEAEGKLYAHISSSVPPSKFFFKMPKKGN